MSEGNEGALAGITVIDAGQLVQAPQAALLLGEMGAEVIKVELPGLGDMSRLLPLEFGSDHRSAYIVGCNRGKRSVTADLRTGGGREIFLDLVERADIVVSNFVPGTMDAWGLGYEACAARNPRIIYGTGSAYGSKGPDAGREGADIGGQAAGGILSRIQTDGPWSPVGVTMADHIGSLNLVSGVLAALHARERTGRGQHVEVSLYGGQIYAQASEYSYLFLTGQEPRRPDRGHVLIAGLYGIFPTADGHIAIVGVPPQARDLFFIAIGREEVSIDERFQVPILSDELKAELFETVGSALVGQPTSHWEATFRELGVRYSPVRDYSAVAADPGAWENGYLQKVEHPEWGEITMPGTPIRFSDTPAIAGQVAPELGQHTDEILAELGRTPEQIAALREAGAI